MNKPTKLHEVGHHVLTWFHATQGSLDDVLRPEYWSHVASQLRPHHRIVVDAWDGTWTATLFVRAATKTDAVVALMSKADMGEPVQPSVDGYRVGWGGPHHKHRVVRESDKAVIEHGFDTAEAAEMWLRDYLRTLNKAA